MSPHGFWLFVGEQELFVPFRDFPWFKDASIREISHVELPSAHLRKEELPEELVQHIAALIEFYEQALSAS